MACTSACGDGGGTAVDDDGSQGGTDSASVSVGDGSTSDATTTAGSASADETTTGAGEGDDGDDGPVKLDVAGIPDSPGNLGSCGNGGKGGDDDEPDFSYIWIANSGEGTVSKINTQTMIEEGRYRVRPDSLGNPSRTSVSLNGDVAVANRAGGLTKINAFVENCPDPANTSTGGDDILAWQDGCIAWYTPFDYSSQRPVAWAPGEWNAATCRYENEKVWTSGATGFGGGVEVVFVDGETGVVEQLIDVPEVPNDGFGIYGGAVDAEGNFWGTQLGGGTMVRVDRETFEYETWPANYGGYGMTVDENGRVWQCSYQATRFDYATETFETQTVNGGGGCMADGMGRIWLASDPLIAVDIETLDVVASIDLPNYVHGVSIDFYGYVWGVTQFQPYAYRVDPVTEDIETFSGLTMPYTYSDMTGWALSNVVGPPPSG